MTEEALKKGQIIYDNIKDIKDILYFYDASIEKDNGIYIEFSAVVHTPDFEHSETILSSELNKDIIPLLKKHLVKLEKQFKKLK